MTCSRIALAFVLAGAAVLAPRTAFATSYSPFLQLEIKNGSYDTITKTTVANSNVFTLYAYLTPIAGSSSLTNLLDQTYYIAAALTPKVATGQDLGSFSFNSSVVRATADMVYGNPPFEPNTTNNEGGTQDLSRSDIYNTYFKEFSFKFKSNANAASCSGGSRNVNCANAYDVTSATSVMQPTKWTGGAPMYFMAFEVDTSALNPKYQVNFDLYSTKAGSGGSDRDIKYLAAAAYDARSRTTILATPEPTSFLLLGTGAVAMIARHVRRRRTGR